ncbi:hypothetical protein [Tsukamurella pseudospumae]|uniref:Tyr recombinase domain-containing protein n=1 Tax=Tsukamurella pseudospumae TaxID=239498 RepID=A0A138A907_9ACTN|nr:hypothetical protein [Tsukamurella pseudospumae]KXP06837.1 hypothetical protein AXK60_12355 [Tsukamurella pseudospumae]
MGPAITNATSAHDGDLAAVIVLHKHVLRPGTPPGKLSRFGDPIWHIAPAHPDAHAKINSIYWDRWPNELVPVFKEIALAFLTRPVPRTITVSSDGELMSIGTVSFRLRTLRVFAAWMSLHQLCGLHEVTDEHLERYRQHVLQLQASNRHKKELLVAVRTVWSFQAVLPQQCRFDAVAPWAGSAPAKLAASPCRPAGAENTTPRIAPATMEPLLHWSLRMVEDIGPDIIAALTEVKQLDAGTHPSQQHLHNLTSRERVQAFVADATAHSRPVPGHPLRDEHEQPRINWRHLARLLMLPSRRVDPCLRPLVLESDLPVADGSPIGAITGHIDGRPWRTSPLSTQELPQLAAHLSVACFVVISYLSGMRPGEVLNLRRGCAQRDHDTGQLLVLGRYGKGAARTPRPTLGDDPFERTWVVVQPVHQAINLLEQLGDTPLLFPSSHYKPHAIRPADRNARRAQDITSDIAAFITWINSTFVRLDHEPVIPPDPAGRIYPSRFRRTLAYFIVRRPRGLIAAALQYGHVSTTMTMSYSGQADTAWLNDLAVERLESVLEHNQRDHELLTAGEHISGPAASNYHHRIQSAHRFAGHVVNRVRNAERLLQHIDHNIHHGNGMTCVYRADTAACRTARITEGLPTPTGPIDTE